MDKNNWKKRIKGCCEAAGTYQNYFDLVIDELAGLLERRDEVAKLYNEDPRPVIEYTNKAEATNTVKNPLLVLINDMDKSALSYWRELGLTPAGLRKINDNVVNTKVEKTNNSLMERLNEFKRNRDGGT